MAKHWIPVRVRKVALFALVVLSVAGLLCCVVNEQRRAAPTEQQLEHPQQRQRQRQLNLLSDPKSVQFKSDSSIAGMTVAIINTPKCGTGGLANTFKRSWRCFLRNDSPIGDMSGNFCPGNKSVWRTHTVESGARGISLARERQGDAKCLVVTAIRDPQTWLPSLFLQGAGSLCDGDRITSRLEFEQRYRRWLKKYQKMIRGRVTSVIPDLLKEFGAQSLTDEMEKINANGGYSLLSHPESTTFQGKSAFAGCNLLLLRMEDASIWPDILSSVAPGLQYTVPKSRVDLCPNIAEHYDSIKFLILTQKEKLALAGGDKYIEEYFRLYRFLE